MLDRVTITGADDSVSPKQIIAIAKKYPFTEWGILFSATQQGKPRFPSEVWLDEELPELYMAGLSLSAHLCGRWVRDVVLRADFTWMDNYDDIARYFKRVQLNFHGEFHRMSPLCPSTLRVRGRGQQFILQCDGPNDATVNQLAHLRLSSGAAHLDAVPLFDKSGGAGVLPGEWPVAWPGIYCGYAGGLGPDNIRTELIKIDVASGGQPFWIDMERRVRSEDDSTLDLNKCEQVFDLSVPFLSSRTASR